MAAKWTVIDSNGYPLGGRATKASALSVPNAQYVAHQNDLPDYSYWIATEFDGDRAVSFVEDVETKKTTQRKDASLSRVEFKLALLDKGYLQDVRDFVETTQDERIKILWEDSDSFHRLDSDLLNMANEMGYTDEQLDDLFGVE